MIQECRKIDLFFSYAIAFVLYNKCYSFQEWQDEFFKWDPKDYNGTEFITVPSSSIWLPDFVLYNRYVIIGML